MKLIASFFTISILLCTCTRTNRFENKSIQTPIKPHTAQLEKKLIKTLIEKRIGSTDYYISFPKDYKIEEITGLGFSGYLFYSTDTVTQSVLHGGVYYGEYLHEFEPDNHSCRIENINASILGQNKNWTVYNCDGIYSIQTIVTTKNHKGRSEQIYFFGSGESRTELAKLLTIYSSVREVNGI